MDRAEGDLGVRIDYVIVSVTTKRRRWAVCTAEKKTRIQVKRLRERNGINIARVRPFVIIEKCIIRIRKYEVKDRK